MSLRAAVLGLGHLGRHHARILGDLSGVELTAVCDTDPSRFDQPEIPRGPLRTQDPEEACARADLVVVAAPTRVHVPLARAALLAGRHVLVEKPLAPSADEARSLLEAARHSGATLLCGHTERFNGAYRALEGRLSGPRFVEGHRLAGFTARSLDVDVVMDLMVHDLDLLLRCVKRPVARVEAAGIPVVTPKVDIASARITFEGGCVANLTASRISERPVRKLRFFDRDSYWSLDFKAQEAVVARLGRGEDGLPRPSQDVITLPGEPLRLELEDFVQTCRARAGGRAAAPAGATGEEALEALELGQRVERAIEEHRASHSGAPERP